LPAVVLMRDEGRRFTWSVDAASGLSARVLEDSRDGMPGRLCEVVWGVDGTWWLLGT
jgi:hypothetical protein